MKVETIKKHEQIAKGYSHIFKSFDLLSKKCEKKNDIEKALLYKKIANRFREIHERYQEAIENIKKGVNHGRREESI